MLEENNHQKQNEDKNQKRPDNFFIHELNERIKIKKQSNLFKKAVDDEKARQLQLIEVESEIREDVVSDKISKLEAALKGDDSELIKKMLKNMEI